MRLSVFVFLALVAIAAAQAQKPASDIDIKAQISECYDKIGDPCQNATDKIENEACVSSLITTEVCVGQCEYDNKDSLQKVLGCYKSICKSENSYIQTYLGKVYTCLSGISILGFTLAASTLALLL
ncbi:hypothetical protein ABPG74_018939 [Tetrahymena malaccensis]